MSAPGGRPAIYPWESWLDLTPHRITRGEDFRVGVEQMRADLHKRAKREGLGVVTHRAPRGGDTLTFYFYRKT